MRHGTDVPDPLPSVFDVAGWSTLVAGNTVQRLVEDAWCVLAADEDESLKRDDERVIEKQNFLRLQQLHFRSLAVLGTDCESQSSCRTASC